MTYCYNIPALLSTIENNRLSSRYSAWKEQMNYEMHESMSLVANTVFRVRSRQLFAHEYVLP
jgi:hypothetical protein